MFNATPKEHHPAPCALVTGSGKRLGRAIATCLAQRGYDVALHYNNSAVEAQQLSEELANQYAGRQFPTVCYDLNDWQKAGDIFDALPKNFGKIEVLVNSASVFRPASIDNTTPAELETNFAVHLFAPFRLMQAFVLKYRQGEVINMLDTKIRGNESTHAAYLLSKKALADLTTMAALAWAPQVRVNGIAPGPVLPATGGTSNQFTNAVAQTPMEQPVDVSEITTAIGYLLDCAHVTGQILYVDSGQHLAP